MLKSLIALWFLALIFVPGCTCQKTPSSSTTSSVAETKISRMPPRATSKKEAITVTTVKKGEGPEAQMGKTVTVHYVGTLAKDRRIFDSSVARKTPYTFTLGRQEVVAGWEDGMLGMKVGEKRHLIIPPSEAYGEEGAGGTIPPNATLIIDVELLKVE